MIYPPFKKLFILSSCLSPSPLFPLTSLSPLLSSLLLPLSSLPLCFVALFSNITHLTQPPPVTERKWGWMGLVRGREWRRVCDIRTHALTHLYKCTHLHKYTPRALLSCVYKRYINFFLLLSECYYCFETHLYKVQDELNRDGCDKRYRVKSGRKHKHKPL